MTQDDTATSNPSLPKPDAAEVKAIETARRSVDARKPRLVTKLEQDKKGNIANIGPTHADVAGWYARLQDAFGTRGQQFPISQLNHVLAAVRGADGRYDTVKANALIAAIEGANPADEVQAMLAVQMAVTHEVALQTLRRAMRVDQIAQFDSAGNMAVKLMRTFTMQVEALAKLQRGGQQVVKIVHVHSGAQAVIGNVQAGGRGGGRDEIGDQPHAPQLGDAGPARSVASEPSAALPCPDTCGEPMPVPVCVREEALPHARRRAGQRRA
jgi:hypothetical protein